LGTSSPKLPDFLGPTERQAFLKKVFSRKDSFRQLSKKTGVGHSTIWQWVKGGRIKRETALRVLERLGKSGLELMPLDQLGFQLRADFDDTRGLLWRVGLWLAEALSLVGVSEVRLTLLPVVALTFEGVEVRLGKSERPFYQTLVGNEVWFEGPISQDMVTFLREFVRWRRLNEKRKRLMREKQFQKFS